MTENWTTVQLQELIAGTDDPEQMDPCPFCGSEVIGVGYVSDISAYQACCQCGALGAEAHTGLAAVAAWNKRDPAIKSLASELLAARAALEPFAAVADRIAVEHPGWDHDEFQLLLGGSVPLKLAAYRAARAALGEVK